MDTSRRSSPHLGQASRGCWHAHPLWGLALACSIVTMPAWAADPPAQARSASPSPTKGGLSGAAILEKAWPGHPEWLAMLADILIKGERLSGGDGWFRTGTAQTRFDWTSVRTALDRDGDDSIAKTEFSGPEADFARLDRNRDGVLTAADFDFATPAAWARRRRLCCSG